MSKNCKKIELDILEKPKDDSVKKHLQECHNCADFAIFAENSLKVFVEKSPLEDPPSQLDIKIKKYASEHIKNNNQQIILFSHSKRSIIVAIAASILLASTVIFFLTEEKINHLRNSQSHNTTKISENKIRISESTSWDNLDLEDDFFYFSTEIHISKELIYFSSTDQEDEFDIESKIEIPNEILI